MRGGDLGRQFATVPTADAERRSPLSRAGSWSPTRLSLFGHSITIDTTTGNLLVSTTDISYRYCGLTLEASRSYDLQEQFMQNAYLRTHANVDPKPRFFGNWRFSHESDIDCTWRTTRPQVHLVAGADVNALFNEAPPHFRINQKNRAELVKVLQAYGIPARTLDALGWSFARDDMVLRTMRGPFQVLTGRVREETLVDPLQAQLWCFAPASGHAWKITSDYSYEASSRTWRDLGFGPQVSHIMDALGHAITFRPTTPTPPYTDWCLQDGAGRSLTMQLRTPISFPDGLMAGRLVRHCLVSAVVDNTKAEHNVHRYEYDSQGRLVSVAYPSSLGDRRVRYIYDSPDFPGALTAMEDSRGTRVCFEYVLDSFDNDDRLCPRLKIARIVDPQGITYDFRYSFLDSESTVAISQEGAVDQCVKYGYIRDEADTRKRYVTRRETSVCRGYALDAAGQIVAMAAIGRQLVREQTSLSVDGRFNDLMTMDPLGRVHRKEYNDFNQVVREWDADNHWTRYTYDIPTVPTPSDPIRYDLIAIERQELVRDLSASGQMTDDEQVVTTSLRYGRYDNFSSARVEDHGVHSTHRCVERIDARGSRWSFSYDDEHSFGPLEPTTSTSPRGSTLTRHFNDRGDVTKVIDEEGNSHAYTYDEGGLPTSYIEPNGAVVRLIYFPEAHWLQYYVDETAQSVEFKRAVDGRIVSVIDAVGDRIDYAYYANGRVSAVMRPRPALAGDPQDPSSATITGAREDVVTTFRYSPLGKLNRLKDPKGLELVFGYDEAGRLSEWFHEPGGVSTRYVYDAAGQRLCVVDRIGRMTHHAYTWSGLPLWTQLPAWVDGRVTRPGKRLTFKQHDYSGRLLTVNDSELPGDEELAYDRCGNLIVKRQPGWELRFDYDEDNHLVRANDAGGIFRVVLDVDALGRVSKLTDSAWKDSPINWHYRFANPMGATRHCLSLFGIDVENPTIASAFDYDAKNRLTSVRHRGGVPPADLYAQSLFRRADDLVEAIAGDDANRFRYDGTKQLVWEDVPPRRSDYDEAGNRLFRVEPSTAPSAAKAVHDRFNRLQSDAGLGAAFTYDAEGSIASATRPGTTEHFAFDGAGNLRSITSGNSAISYVYDRSGALVRRTNTDLGSGVAETTVFRYALGKPVAIDVDGSLSLLLTWGPDGRLLRRRSTQKVGAGTHPHSLFCLYDGLGTLVRLVDDRCAPVVKVAYDAWGGMSIVDPNGLFDYWGYRNGFLDRATGYVLFGARWYAPSMGRWLSEDPTAGAAPDAGKYEACTNLYRYVLNCPTGLSDPSGCEADRAQLGLLKEAAETRYEKYRAALREYGPRLAQMRRELQQHIRATPAEKREALWHDINPGSRFNVLMRNYLGLSARIELARNEWRGAVDAVYRAQGVGVELKGPYDWMEYGVTEGVGAGLGLLFAGLGMFTGATEGAIIGFSTGLLIDVVWDTLVQE